MKKIEFSNLVSSHMVSVHMTFTYFISIKSQILVHVYDPYRDLIAPNILP